MFKLQPSKLDFNYLQKWAKILELSEDLEQALRESY